MSLSCGESIIQKRRKLHLYFHILLYEQVAYDLKLSPVNIIIQKKPSDPNLSRFVHSTYFPCVIAAISAGTQETQAGFMDKLTFYYAYHGQ